MRLSALILSNRKLTIFQDEDCEERPAKRRRECSDDLREAWLDYFYETASQIKARQAREEYEDDDTECESDEDVGESGPSLGSHAQRASQPEVDSQSSTAAASQCSVCRDRNEARAGDAEPATYSPSFRTQLLISTARVCVTNGCNMPVDLIRAIFECDEDALRRSTSSNALVVFLK